MTSRSYDEYVAMFGLGPSDLSGTVVDCSAGAASFVTVAAGRGCRAIAVDPAYAMAREDIAVAVRADLERGSTIARLHPDRFVWDWYGSAPDRDRMRRGASARFLADFATGTGRYVAGELPRLPLRDGVADLVLCSHLLFTWADTLGLDWHLAALLELARVSRGEVRVFPTVMQGHGHPVPFWDELMTRLADRGLRGELRRVAYRFQVSGDQMLVLAPV